MANVIHIRRQPTGLEQAGQSMQDLTNNFIQQTLAMTQQQNAQNMQMMGLGMQERRLADANARDDRRWKEHTAMQERRFAHEDKWKEQQLALQKQQLWRSLAAMDKPQLTQVEGPYGNKISVWANPRTREITPASIPGMDSGAGGGSIPGLDAAANAAADEVLQPDWSPSSPMGRKGLAVLYPHLAEEAEDISPVPSVPTQAEVQLPKTEPLSPSMRSNQSPWAHTFDLLGVKIPQQGQPQAETSTPLADSSPVQPSSQEMPQAPQMPQMPEPAHINANGVKITVANFPPVLMKIPAGRAVFDLLKAQDEANTRKYDMAMKGVGADPKIMYSQEFAKNQAKKMSDYIDELEKEYTVAQQTLPDIQATEALLDAGLKTGWGTEAMAGLSNVLQRFGFTDEDMKKMNLQGASDIQAARSIVERNVLNKLAAQKGVQTEGDAQRARQTGFMLTNTPEANRYINQHLNNLVERNKMRIDFLIKSVESGKSRRAAENEWDAYNKKLPSVLPNVPSSGSTGSTLPPPPTGFKVVN